MSELEVKHPAFAERLNEMMQLRNVGITELSNASGIEYEMVRRYTHGYAKPRERNLRKISDALNASITYLSYGELPKEKVRVSDLQAKMDAIVNKKNSTEMPSSDFKIAKAISSDKTPVISWVAAGSWTEIDSVTLDDVIETIPKLDHLSDRQFGLKIQGRSMLPKFKPGDIIYVEPEITPWELRDGDLIVVQCNDGKSATFKQLVIGETAEDMYLRPLNPDWPEQRLVPMGECELVGIADTKIEALRTRLR